MTDGTAISLQHHQKQRNFFAIFWPAAFALGYASFLASLPIDVFIDRKNYIIYTYISDIVLLRNQMAGLLSVFSNEPLWLLMNIFLSRFTNPEDTVRIFIFVPSFISSFLVLRHRPKDWIWLTLFLIFPLFVKNYIIHIRQGVAIAFFLVGFFSNNRLIKIAFFIASPLIHSSFFFVLMIMSMINFSRALNISLYLRVAAFFGMFIFIGLSMQLISSNLGARQGAEYIGASIEVSGIAFIFWMSIFVIFLSFGQEFLEKNLFQISMLSFYLCTYFTTAVSGRIFESSIILILISGLSLEGVRRKMFLGVILVFMMSNYAMRYSQPYFGWGAF